MTASCRPSHPEGPCSVESGALAILCPASRVGIARVV